MRNKFFLCLFVLVSLTACKDTKWVEVPGGMLIEKLYEPLVSMANIY